ncbi:hypothetical protein Ndes2437B_g01537 [Nannochloris sp. 'desiccata']
MQTPSGATSDTSVTDLLEDHFDSLGDFATSLSSNLAEPAASPISSSNEHDAKENAPNNEKTHKVVKNNILYEPHPSCSPLSMEELDSAKAEASAWRASQEALVNRVHLLESRILEEAARADAGYSAAEAAQHSLAAGFGDFKHQSTLMVEECAQREAELVAHFTALNQTKDEEHSVALSNLQKQLQTTVEEKNRLLETLEDDHREALELRGRVENTEQLQSAVRELTRQKKILESQLYTSQSSLEKEKASTKDLFERLIAAEASAMQATQQAEAACRQWDTAAQEAQQAQKRESQATDKLKNLQNLQSEGTANAQAVHNTAKEQLAALSELAHKRGAALRQIVALLAGTDPGNDVCDPDTDSDYAVQLVISVCQGVVDAENEWGKEKAELHEALEEAMEGSEDLIRRLRKEETRNKELENQEADARAVLGAVEKIQNRAVMAEKALAACREEMENAASKAAASVMEAAQLKAVAAAAEEALKVADARALQAEAEVAVLRQGSGAKDQRADEMRAAAAVAMEVAQSLQSSIQQACTAAATEMQQAVMALEASSLEDTTSDNDNTIKQQSSSCSNTTGILNAVYSCIDRLQEAAAMDTSSNKKSCSGRDLAAAVELALLEASSGFSSVAALVQEYGRVHDALLRAVGRPTEAETEAEGSRKTNGADVVVGDGQQETSLEALLSDLLDRFSGLTAAVQTEKSSLEEQLSTLRAEHAELLTHAESLESVLRSAVHAGPAMDTTGEALLQLVAARRRISELESGCAALAKRERDAQQAAEESKASASRDWAEVRSDVAQLVQHAERAQIDAELALQQQRAETARLVSEARAREHVAGAAQSEAEARASQLRQEAAGLHRELQIALSTATTWETLAKSAEDALEVATTRLQEAKHQQQEQQRTGDVGDGNNNTITAGSDNLLAVLQPSAHLSSEDIDTLRRRVFQLESALNELQEHAAISARELIEARGKAEVAEEAAAAHHAASEAAMRQVEIATTRATEAEMKRAALELEYLEQQTLQQQQSTLLPGHQPRSSLPSLTATTSPDNNSMLKATLPMPPPTADIPTLRRRLEAALRQVEGLKSLNANLEEQLIAHMNSLSTTTSLTGHSTAGSAGMQQQRQQVKNLADATAHAMIDALQLEMEAMGMMTRKQQQQGEESRWQSTTNGRVAVVVPGATRPLSADVNTVMNTTTTNSGGGPIERVVALWKQACATRDEKLEEAARRLQSAGIELGAKEAELAAMRQAEKALKKARNEAITAAAGMEKRMREALSCKRSLEAQVAAAKTGLEDRDLLRERISTLETKYSALEKQATASELRAAQAEKALASAQSATAAAKKNLISAEEAERRARAATERASEAEKALARHLESQSQQGSTSLGKQLEAAWATERELAQKVQELQIEVSGAKYELESAVKDVERLLPLQEQLNEAVGALAEQGAALEAVQFALQAERALRTT